VPDDPFAHSYHELIQLMRCTGTAIAGAPRRALEAEAIVYACLESAHTNQPVLVADILSGKACAYEQTVWEARSAMAGTDLSRFT